MKGCLLIVRIEAYDYDMPDQQNGEEHSPLDFVTKRWNPISTMALLADGEIPKEARPLVGSGVGLAIMQAASKFWPEKFPGGPE